MGRDRLLLALSLLAIALATVPWSGFVGHPHWARVTWIPDEIRVGDMVGNVLLYLPLGWSAARVWNARRAGTLIVGGAAGLSATVEWLQIWSHGRFPTTTDLLMNTLGAAAGVWLARRLPRKIR